MEHHSLEFRMGLFLCWALVFFVAFCRVTGRSLNCILDPELCCFSVDETSYWKGGKRCIRQSHSAVKQAVGQIHLPRWNYSRIPYSSSSFPDSSTHNTMRSLVILSMLLSMFMYPLLACSRAVAVFEPTSYDDDDRRPIFHPPRHRLEVWSATPSITCSTTSDSPRASDVLAIAHGLVRHRREGVDERGSRGRCFGGLRRACAGSDAGQGRQDVVV